MEIIFLLVIVLTVVTLVGHGIWVLLAALIRLISGKPKEKKSNRGYACPRCWSPLFVGQKTCHLCRWPNALPHGSQRPEVVAHLKLRLQKFAELGSIDEPTVRELTHLIEQLEKTPPELGTAADSEGIDFIEAEVVEEVSEASSVEESAAETKETPEEETEEVTLAEPLDVAERARRFAAARMAAATAAIEPPEPTPQPSPRREALSRVLSAFMEERNIRWGELVGGLLIVCCSIALVISFWSQIAGRPLLKFVIFNGVSAALFGAGFYTLRRWQIHTTSQGLLIIATLLVPLNFLAMAALTKDTPPTDAISIGGEVMSLAVFAVLCWFAARSLVPSAPWLLAVAVMVPSLAQLITRRFITDGDDLSRLYSLAALPVFCYVAVNSWFLLQPRSADAEAHSNRRSPGRVFILLGVSTYAALLALGLLVYLASPMMQTLGWLSPLIALFGLPALTVGLLFWRRRVVAAGATDQTIAMSIGVAGALVMLAAILLAWPHPVLLMATGLTCAALFAALAVRLQFAAAHLVTCAGILAAWLIGFHLLRGELSWHVANQADLLRALLSASSGNALILLVGILAGIAGLSRFWDRNDEARWYFIGAGATAAISLALIFLFGFARAGDPSGATWTLAIYAAGATIAAFVVARPEVAWAATLLLLAAILQGVVFRFAAPLRIADPWILAFLLHATISTIGAISHAVSLRSTSANLPWQHAATATSLVAVVLMFFQLTQIDGFILAIYGGVIAVLWLVLAMLGRSSVLFAAFQCMLSFATMCLVCGWVQQEDWYLTARRPWLDPWFLIAQGTVLSLLGIGWTATRLATSDPALVGGDASVIPLSIFARLLHVKSLPIDRLAEVALVATLVIVAIYGAAPGVAQELAVTPAANRVAPDLGSFEILGANHRHAIGWGTGLLWLATAVMVMVGLRHDSHAVRVIALFVIGAMICPMVAACFEPPRAAASALRWAIGGYAVVASILIWARREVKAIASRFAMINTTRADNFGDISINEMSRGLVIALVVAAYAVMGIYVASSAVSQAGVPRGFGTILIALAVIGGVSTLVAMLVIGIQRATSSRQAAARHDSNGYVGATTGRLWQTILLMGLSPLIAGGIYVVADALRNFPIVGPGVDSWSFAIGKSASYGVPLAALIVALLGHTFRERSAAYAFAAALFVNLLATIVFLMELATAGRVLDTTAWLQLAQLNAIVTSIYSLAWLTVLAAGERQLRGPEDLSTKTKETSSLSPLLGSYVVFGASLTGASLAWAVAIVFLRPDSPISAAVAGNWLGWLALALTLAAVCWSSQRAGQRLTFVAAACSLGLLAAMMAVTSIAWDNGNWLAFHVLLVGFSLAAWVAPLLATSIERRQATAAVSAAGTYAATFFAAITVVLSLRALFGDPQSPWWTLGGLLAMAALTGCLAWTTAKQRFVWAGAVLVNIAASIWWIETGNQFWPGGRAAYVLDFVQVNVIAAAVTAIFSVGVRRKQSASGQSLGAAWHNIAVWITAGMMLLVVAAGLARDWTGSPVDNHVSLPILAVMATIGVAVVRLWDANSRFTVACLYSVGAIAPGMLLDRLNVFDSQTLVWVVTLFAAAYALATSYLWSRRGELTAAAARLGTPLALSVEAARQHDTAPTYPGHLWLLTCNSIIALVSLVSVFWIQLSFYSWTQRNAAAYAVAALAVAIGLLSRGRLQTPLRYVALVYGVLFAVAWEMSWLSPNIEAPLLNRAIVTLAALVFATFAYGFGLVKFWRAENEWTRAALRLTPTLVGLAALLTLVVIGLEASHFFNSGLVPVSWPARVVVAVVLLGLALAALAAAVLPGRDPLGLSEKGRSAYVYAAEFAGAVLFAHLRMTVPWLFSGWFQQMWPLVVMGIAFVGVGFSEYCHRRRQSILSQPLERTAALLPLLPLLGFWIVPSGTSYSQVLLTIAALYAALAVLRRSFFFSMLAVAAANGSLWRMLYTYDGLSLADHPQLWLIPPAMCVLVATYLNRQRLGQAQMTAIRYLATIVIYASSTADIFLNGVGTAPWLPGVLALLAIAGIFAGIVFRIRAFLFLGTTFLVVALLTIIWYAAFELEHTWIWWVSGIIVGVMIIALFGLFEKKRDDVLRVVEDLKRWES